MKEILIGKLLEYIRDNNPDILFALEAEDKLRLWLYSKADSVESRWQQMEAGKQPAYIIEETCLNELTRELRPSRYNYISNLLEQEFEKDYKMLVKAGLLQHEVVNMIGYCDSVFEDLKFSEETEDNRFIYYAISGAIGEYLDSNSVREIVSNELQQSAET
ncbi:MAG: DUF1896 domain-containing protein [Chitinophagaceae bacterium]|jgi:hypothetical protein|nr:DUF1896 domain-containing protein [Chitinophagaceae bacterium]